jgi:hypothetical protein
MRAVLIVKERLLSVIYIWIEKHNSKVLVEHLKQHFSQYKNYITQNLQFFSIELIFNLQGIINHHIYQNLAD